MNKLLTLLITSAMTLSAATFNVTTTPELRTALTTAATNGEDDTIVLADGTYKTTDDGEGTFIYFEQYTNALTLIGDGNVILDGNNTEQILKSSSGYLTIDNISFINGSSISNGGAIAHTSAGLYIDNCEFNGNVAARSGGAIYANSGIEVVNSKYQNNTSNGGTGSWENGGAIFFDGRATINNSKFIDNISTGTLTRPGGMSIYADFDSYINIYNSIFSSDNTDEKSAHVSILRGHSNVVNSLFNSSKTNIGLFGTSTLNIVNSVFLNTGSYNIIADDDGRASVYNSYFDNSKTYGGYILYEESNLVNNISLGFVDVNNSEYNLTVSSDLIDAGTTSIAGVTFSTTDLNGNARIAGGSIDIGPYEFSTTRPTINSVTYTGTTQEQQELTFTTDSIASTGRSITSVEYDYLNNGIFTTTNTYIYQTAGTYTVNVKVTDSEGEFSSTTKTVIIAELPFADMTDEQKLVDAIDPTYYDDIIAIIDTEKASSNASGITTGENNVVLDPSSYGLFTQAELDTVVSDTNTSAYEAGKQYVLNNLSEFDLFTLAEKLLAESNAETTGKAYVQANPAEFSLVTQTASDAAVATATSTGDTTGRAYVQNNPTEFSLVTVADKDTAVATATVSGREMVITSPSAYGLVSTAELNSSASEALANGVVQGKEYVQNNLSEFGLVTKSDIELTASNISGLSASWTLASTPFALTDLSMFDSASIIWVYSNSSASWSAYSSDATMKQNIIDATTVNTLTTIPAGSGIWIQK